MNTEHKTEEFHYDNSDGQVGFVAVTHPYLSIWRDEEGKQVGSAREMPFMAQFEDAVWADAADTERLALWLLARSASDFHRREWATSALQALEAERALLGE